MGYDTHIKYTPGQTYNMPHVSLASRQSGVENNVFFLEIAVVEEVDVNFDTWNRTAFIVLV